MKSFKHFDVCTFAQQIERWENVARVLINMPDHMRRKHWDMSFFGYKNECGTIACAAGHCGLDPWFRRRGFKMDFVKRSSLGGTSLDQYEISDCENFFGLAGTSHIFYKSSRRSVSAVIKEVKNHIKKLKANDGPL